MGSIIEFSHTSGDRSKRQKWGYDLSEREVRERLGGGA